MKILTFKAKAKVENGKVTVDESTKVLSDDTQPTEFDESLIAKKAQEIAETNKSEIQLAAAIGDGECFVEIKIIA